MSLETPGQPLTLWDFSLLKMCKSVILMTDHRTDVATQEDVC